MFGRFERYANPYNSSKQMSAPEIFERILAKIAKVDAIGATSRLGLTVEIKGVYNLAPMLWLEFLNADPEQAVSMWPIYRDFIRFVEDMRDWVVEAGCPLPLPYRNQAYEDTGLLQKITLYSREDFLKHYPKRLKAPAKWVHGRMGKIIDDNIPDLTRDMTREALGETESLSVPPMPFTMRLADEGDSYSLRFYIPQASHPNFWLSTIMGSMFFSAGEGTSVSKCAAPDCNQYFIPTPRGRGQLYHSQRCQNRHYMRKRRSRGIPHNEEVRDGRET